MKQKDNSLFLQKNLRILHREFQAALDRWRRLPLLLTGMASLFMMIQFQKFPYVLQNAPWPIPDAFFNGADATLHTLLRGGGTP